MLARLFPVYFLAFFSSLSFAQEANWNCQQDKTTQKWDCVGSAGSDGASSKPTPTVKANPEVEQNDNLSTSKEDDQLKKIDPPNNVEPELSGVRDNNELPRSNPQDEAIANEKPDVPKVEEKSVPTAENPVSEQPLTPSDIPETSPPLLSASEKPVPISKKKVETVTDAKQRGWNCDTKGKDGNWNCQLVGPDPKGEARSVELQDQGGFSLFSSTFDNKEENIFNTLRDRFKNNPWGNCSIQLGTQKYFIPDNKDLRAKANVDMNSNAAEIYDNEIGNYQGRVEMKRADQQASSNSANYDSVSEALDLHGNVFYSEDELSLYTESATLKLASDEARLRETLFISPTTPIRGRANAIYRDNKFLSRYNDVAYTACEPGNQDWIVHATDLKLNKKSGSGSAKNAWVEFKGIPIFYSPYLTFPIDDRRKSGFLAPNFHNTERGGFQFSAPFYWNIAPNYDAIIKPRYYSKRGGLLAADFRYLTETSSGLISAEYMPDDTITKKERYLGTLKNTSHFTPHISSNLDLNIVSDRAYYIDLGNALSFPYFSNVRSYGDLSYIDKGISLVGRIENYQNIDPAFVGRLTPYRRLPQLNLNLDHSFASFPSTIGLESEYVYFQHDDTSIPDGQRINVKPYVSFPLQTAGGFITPKFSLQHTDYLLNNQKQGVSDSIGRTVPIASIDSGLFFEKDINIAGSSLSHTLEPRLFYLFIPKVNQDDIPIFDSSLYDFQYDSLFRENRFSGTDRIQDANQITAALTSRLIDSETGLEKLKVSIGDTLYFQDRTVTVTDVRVGSVFLESPVQTSTFSPLVAELSGSFNKHISVDSGIQWDPDSNEIVRGKAMIHLVNEPGELLNLGFLYRKNNLIRDSIDRALIEGTLPKATLTNLASFRNNDSIIRSNDIIQSDISFRWPIFDNWFAVGRWQYSFLYNVTQEAFAGFEKENCCWRFRIIGREYVNNIVAANNQVPGQNLTSGTQSGIFFQIEFKGLTGLGTNLDDFFLQSIPGYQKKDY